jgi:hypothetical protein
MRRSLNQTSHAHQRSTTFYHPAAHFCYPVASPSGTKDCQLKVIWSNRFYANGLLRGRCVKTSVPCVIGLWLAQLPRPVTLCIYMTRLGYHLSAIFCRGGGLTKVGKYWPAGSARNLKRRQREATVVVKPKQTRKLRDGDTSSGVDWLDKCTIPASCNPFRSGYW